MKAVYLDENCDALTEHAYDARHKYMKGKSDVVIVNVGALKNIGDVYHLKKAQVPDSAYHSQTPSPCITPLPSVETVETPLQSFVSSESKNGLIMINNNAGRDEAEKTHLLNVVSSSDSDSVSLHEGDVRFVKSDKHRLLPDSVELDSLSSLEDATSFDNSQLILVHDEEDDDVVVNSYPTLEETSFTVPVENDAVEKNSDVNDNTLTTGVLISHMQPAEQTVVMEEQFNSERSKEINEAINRQNDETCNVTVTPEKELKDIAGIGVSPGKDTEVTHDISSPTNNGLNVFDSDVGVEKDNTTLTSTIHHDPEQDEADDTEIDGIKKMTGDGSDGSEKEEEHEMNVLLPQEHELSASRDDDGDNSSEFCGSLGIEMKESTWETTMFDQLDIQLGENEWNTKFLPITGGASKDNWPTTINDISKSGERGADWSTEINNMVNNEIIENEWSTHIAQQFKRENREEFWTTKFNSIEKVRQEENTWSTSIFSIRKRVSNENEWKTRFNSIASNRNSSKANTWKVKIPDRLATVSKPTDWKTRFNSISKRQEVEPWSYKENELEITYDKENDWTTQIKETQKRDTENEPWDTTFNTIAPRPPDEEQKWSFTFNEFEKRVDSENEWHIKFIDIEEMKPNEPPWTITMNDTPDDEREDADWASKFNTIEPVPEELNPWNTSFNNITPRGDESSYWQSKYLETDLADMSRDTWDTSFNNIMPKDNEAADWLLTINTIEGVVE